ncbi:MAG TPA: MBL fold metallo-hydrolase [Acidimicrobiales bacterium]|nr:MBL fold metallo-hydrolase [Acidimicrobiales bacterium]
MKVTLLGTGGPRPDVDRAGPATLVEHGGHSVLVDAGRGVATQLLRAGVGVEEIDVVLITHFHYDHTVALDDVIMSAWNNGRTRPLKLIGPVGLARLVEDYFTRIHAADILFRLKECLYTGEDLVHPRELVDITELAGDRSTVTELFDGELAVEAEPVDHGHAFDLSREEWPCLGYRLTAGGRAVAVSGDAIDCPGLRRLALGADVLVQCCYYAGIELSDPVVAVVAELVLAAAPSVGPMAEAAGVGTLVLTHIRRKSPEVLDSMVAEVRAHFDGEVVAGTDLWSRELG